MTDLRTLIPEEEKTLLSDYIKMYLHSDECNDVDEINHLLRFWAAEKPELFELLGNNLMVKKHIRYEASNDDLADKINEMYDEIYNNPELEKVKDFINAYEQITSTYYHWMDTTLDKDERMYCCAIIEHCLDTESLVVNKNQYMLDWGPKSVVLNRGPHAEGSKPLELKTDMKLMRMMAKIVDWFELDKDAFEQFRILHSRVLNDRMIDADLVLSIHPLDYLTMSDNDCNWDSCMNWYNGGDYRLGTIEMMNSPVVLEAYVESDHPYYPLNYYGQDTERTWSNKRWRCLYIVNKDIITEVKQYPYFNIYLRDFVMNKIKKLAEENMGWHYDDKMYEVWQNQKNTTNFGEVFIRMKTGAMYNDYYDNHSAYINPTVDEVEINYSGETECMCCGKGYHVEPSGNVDAFTDSDKVVCASCEGKIQCDECGSWIDESEAWFNNWTGAAYCSWCADGRMATCSCCDERKWLDYDFKKQSLPYMFVVKTPNGKHQRDVKGPFDVCDDCYDDYDFDDVPKEVDEWGDYQYIDVDKVDEKIWRPFLQDKGPIVSAKEYLKRTYPNDYVQFKLLSKLKTRKFIKNLI